MKPNTYRLIETVDIARAKYSELWALDYDYGALYQIRTITLRGANRPDVSHADYTDMESAFQAFNLLKAGV
jgi:hypothetical protein